MAICLMLLLCIQVCLMDASHFRGGGFVWRPLNSTPSGGATSIVVRQRLAWRLSSYTCSSATIAAQTPTIGDAGPVNCVSGNCSGWIIKSTVTPCTDFSSALDLASGERYDIQSVPLNVQFSVAFTSCCWFATLVIGASGAWSVVARISTVLRPDGYINSSPTTVNLPVIYRAINIQHVHGVHVVDFDGTDEVRCRWSNTFSNTNSFDECGSVCNGLPWANLYPNNCTITFVLTTASFYAAVALQIEDYHNNASTTPMSSVPLQFLFYGHTTPPGCNTPPAIIGSRPNRACISVAVGGNVSDDIIVQVYCSGKSIVDLVSVSPTGMIKSPITNPSSGIYQISIRWIPIAAQFGPQAFCAGAVDNTNIQSAQWCITYVVGVDAPVLIQSSANPAGSTPQNTTRFQIQASKPVSRPTRNSTFIYFTDVTTGTIVRRFDCAWEPEVTYLNTAIAIQFLTAPWIVGHSYSVTFDSGVASGVEACHLESAPVTSTTFWTFTVSFPTNATAPANGTTTSVPTVTTMRSSALTTRLTSRTASMALFAPAIILIGLTYQ